jgi:hypothetical protein
MAVDELHATILRDHDGDGVRHGTAIAINRTMPCADGIDELGHERVAFKVHCASHVGHRGKSARNLGTEAEDLEALRHDDCAVHGGERGNQMTKLEEAFVELRDARGRDGTVEV